MYSMYNLEPVVLFPFLQNYKGLLGAHNLGSSVPLGQSGADIFCYFKCNNQHTHAYMHLHIRTLESSQFIICILGEILKIHL